MDAIWFFQRLDLSPTRDTRSIKRAYAIQLKNIDQGTQLEEFTRLRQALELAMSWASSAARPADDVVEETPFDLPPLSMDKEPTTEPRQEHQPASQHLALPATETTPSFTLAQEAIASLKNRLQQTASYVPVGPILEKSLQQLRTEDLQASSIFEILLIEQLAQGQLIRRAELFDAAAEKFGWHEFSSLDANVFAAHWVSQVIEQKQAWQSLKPHARERWHRLLLMSESLTLPEPIIRSWPEISHLMQQYPQWSRLHIDTATLETWESRYREWETKHHARSWEIDENMAAAMPPRSNTGHRKLSPLIALFAVFILMHVIRVFSDLSKQENTLATHSEHATTPYSTSPGAAPFLPEMQLREKVLLGNPADAPMTEQSCATARTYVMSHSHIFSAKDMNLDDVRMLTLLAKCPTEHGGLPSSITPAHK